ncbi:MAG: hypothetical protein R2912_00690 [Eubacteriales bacterium]
MLEREPERVSRLQEICRYVRAGLTERGIPHKYTAGRRDLRSPMKPSAR